MVTTHGHPVVHVKTPRSPLPTDTPIEKEPEWYEEDQEVVQERQLLEDLDDIMAGDDDDDDDEEETGEGGHRGMSALKKAKLARQKKQETLKRQHAGRDYNAVMKPMYRYIAMGLPIPIGSDGKYKVLKGKSLFRAVAWHVISFYAGPKVSGGGS